MRREEPLQMPNNNEALFGHMTEYDQLYTDNGEYPYASIEEAFAACSPSLLVIEAENHPNADHQFLYSVPNGIESRAQRFGKMTERFVTASSGDKTNQCV